MRKIFVISVALQGLISFVGTAQAAPPPPSPAYNWSGFYTGLNLGGAWANVNSDYNATLALVGDPSASGSMSMSGVIGGAQVGYDWQAGQWVFGLETDFQGSSQTGSTFVTVDPALITVTDAHSIRLPWFGTVRGLFGLTPTPLWLVYVTGGLAYGEIEENNAINDGGFAYLDHSVIQSGWVLGGGVETALWTNWTARFEYLFIDLGHFNDSGMTPDGFVNATISSHLTDNIVRVALSYHFH